LLNRRERQSIREGGEFLKRHVIACSLGVAFLVQAAAVAAQITTEEGASILFFPTVVADAGSDTLIQIVNGSLLPRGARCFYVGDADAKSAGSCRSESFLITLVAQQPTHWVVSEGRVVNLLDPQCDRNSGNLRCEGAGFDPGRIPAQASGFQGHLVCVQVDASGAPVGGNALYGQATIFSAGSADAAKYSAVGLAGFESNDGDDTLCLGGRPSERCPSGAEYAACPETWILGHSPDGTVSGEGSAARSIRSSLAIIPCAPDLTGATAPGVEVSLTLVNELAQAASATTSITCRAEFQPSDLSDAFGRDSAGTDFAQTFIEPEPNSGGVIVSARVLRRAEAAQDIEAEAAVDLHSSGARARQEVILLPPLVGGGAGGSR
jgi:hypothetical protein